MAIIEFDYNDVVSIDDFGLNWRFTDERWNRLPDADLCRIRPLSIEKCASLRVLEASFRQKGPYTTSTELYAANFPGNKVIDEAALDFQCDADFAKIQGWFEKVIPTATRRVIVSWFNFGPATVIVDRDVFIRYWDDFFYPFDALNVYDETVTWAILAGQREYALLVRIGIVQLNCGVGG